MSDAETKTYIEKYEALLRKKGIIHGTVQTLIYWVVAVAWDILHNILSSGGRFSVTVDIIKDVVVATYAGFIFVLNIALIPIRFVCERRVCEGEKENTYFICSSASCIITSALITLFIFSPMFDPIFDLYLFPLDRDTLSPAVSYVFFLATYAVGVVITALARSSDGIEDSPILDIARSAGKHTSNMTRMSWALVPALVAVWWIFCCIAALSEGSVLASLFAGLMLAADVAASRRLYVYRNEARDLMVKKTVMLLVDIGLCAAFFFLEFMSFSGFFILFGPPLLFIYNIILYKNNSSDKEMFKALLLTDPLLHWIAVFVYFILVFD